MSGVDDDLSGRAAASYLGARRAAVSLRETLLERRNPRLAATPGLERRIRWRSGYEQHFR